MLKWCAGIATTTLALTISACNTVDSTTSNDVTPATIGIVVTGEAWRDDDNKDGPEPHPFTLTTREHRGTEPIAPIPGGSARIAGDIRNLAVVMTAQDNESGIKRLALKVNRDVCYHQPNATQWSAPFYDHNGTFPYDGNPSERTSEATFNDPTNLPTSPTLNHSLMRGDLLRVELSPGVVRNGEGGTFTFYGETDNGGVGGLVTALPLILTFGDTGCVGGP
jgi:hypothetical protein